jgi:diadenosine tetraphosphate (Ap4A) HIT family hydrolase
MAFTGDDCQYCRRDARLTQVAIEIGRMDVSTLYLFREQTYKGRCIVALNTHETELFRLDEDALRRFSRDVAAAAAAIQQAFSPAKINYAVYGDLVPHLHYHVVPKYKNGESWGKPFEVNPPGQKHLNAEGYREIIQAIKAHLSPRTP